MSAVPSYASLAEPALRPKMSTGVHIARTRQHRRLEMRDHVRYQIVRLRKNRAWSSQQQLALALRPWQGNFVAVAGSLCGVRVSSSRMIELIKRYKNT